MKTDFPLQDRINWSPWQSLEGCWQNKSIPSLPGLYRIRRAGEERLDYVGQTGMGTMTLRKRLAMLSGVYKNDMPYRDPHTAAPALWALLRATNTPFEASVAPIDGSTLWRKGLECVAIALYRQEWGRSPTVQFGRMPAGFRASSANNARLVAMGKRFRGGPDPEQNESHRPSIPPIGPLDGAVTGDAWCGHAWSPWTPIELASGNIPAANGLYRIRRRDAETLLYIGQGLVSARLGAHLAKGLSVQHRQAEVFAQSQVLQASWVLSATWYPHERLELETDLIGAHMLATGVVPPGQFLG